MQLPQWTPSDAGSSGSSSSSVRITPRNSQLPCSRLTRLVCLPCQPIPAACGERLFHHRRGVDEHLELARRPLDDEPRERLQRLLDRLVIVAALRIDRDAPALGSFGQRHRIGRRRIAHPERDRRPRLRPQRGRRHAWSARASIQPIVPWCPASSQRRTSSPAASAASARAKPQAAKPSRSASARIASLRVRLLSTGAPISPMPRHSVRNFSASTGLAAKLDQRIGGRGAGTWSRISARSAPSTASAWRCRPARSSACSAPTARARPPRSRMLLGIIEPSSRRALRARP